MNTQLKLIGDAWDALRWALDNKTINWAEKLFEKCKEEERGHRGFLSDFALYHPKAISMTQAAKLFAVRRVAEYLLKPKYPGGKEYLHTQTSCFIAAGIADEFGAEIRKAWTDFDLKVLAALNYTDFIKASAAGVPEFTEAGA